MNVRKFVGRAKKKNVRCPMKLQGSSLWAEADLDNTQTQMKIHNKKNYTIFDTTYVLVRSVLFL